MDSTGTVSKWCNWNLWKFQFSEFHRLHTKYQKLDFFHPKIPLFVCSLIVFGFFACLSKFVFVDCNKNCFNKIYIEWAWAWVKFIELGFSAFQLLHHANLKWNDTKHYMKHDVQHTNLFDRWWNCIWCIKYLCGCECVCIIKSMRTNPICLTLGFLFHSPNSTWFISSLLA